jgi:histidine triad (HIT) family protein
MDRFTITLKFHSFRRIARSMLKLARTIRSGILTSMAEKTLFEKICAKEIPTTLLHEDERCVAFRDISPQAPTHILIIPRQVIPRVGLATAQDEALLGHLLLVAGELARKEGIAETGYRLVINHGPDGGESVPHLHVHLIGGRKLEWPSG